MERENAVRMGTQVIAGQSEAATPAAVGELTAAKKYAHKRISRQIEMDKERNSKNETEKILAFLMKMAGKHQAPASRMHQHPGGIMLGVSLT
jgi:hypothetical protein